MSKPSHVDYLLWRRDHRSTVHFHMEQALRNFKEHDPALTEQIEEKYRLGREEHNDDIFDWNRAQFRHEALSECIDLSHYVALPIYIASLSRFRK